MGFFDNLADAIWKPRLADPVQGTAQVVSASMPPHKSGGGGMCVMNLVITIPGQPSAAVRKASIVRLAQWPMPGVVLPVLAERTDPRKYVILWDQVPSGAERGAQQAEQIASRINGAATPGGTGAGAGRSGGLFGAMTGSMANITVNGQPATAETLAALEAMTGMDLNGDGRIGGQGASPGGAASVGADDDGVADVEERLRHLRSLRDGDLISESEYQAKRAEILARL